LKRKGDVREKGVDVKVRKQGRKGIRKEKREGNIVYHTQF